MECMEVGGDGLAAPEALDVAPWEGSRCKAPRKQAAAAGPTPLSAKSQARLRALVGKAVEGIRPGWLAAVDKEDFEEVKRLSLAAMEMDPEDWRDDEKTAERSASWINDPLRSDLAIEAQFAALLRRHPGDPQVEMCVGLFRHLCATPLELALVLGKRNLFDALREEWARGRKHRDGLPRAPKWRCSAGPTVRGGHRIGLVGDMGVGFGPGGVALGSNLFLWAFMRDRSAYLELVRMGFCEMPFLGELALMKDPLVAAALLAEFGRRKGRYPLDQAAIARFVERRRDASGELRVAMLEFEQEKDARAARRVRAALARDPFVEPGCLSCAALGGSPEFLEALLEAGANPNGWVGGSVCEWAFSADVDPEMHRIWMEHGGNPFLRSGSPLGFWAHTQSPMQLAIERGSLSTVEAFLRMAGEPWPLTLEDAERLAKVAEMRAFHCPHLAQELAAIARVLREEPRRQLAEREREELMGDGGEFPLSSPARRL